MKLRTLSSKKFPLFVKDVTRFAPLWGVYLIGGLLVLLSAISDMDYYSAASDLAGTIGPFAAINLIYAALCAQLLFGDLFNSRLCNAIHALPQRRETWFLTHIVSGLCFSLVPHLIAVLILVPMLGSYGFIALLWLLGMTLEFLFFYGLAVFSVFCTGNRFAMAAVYAILNFAAMILYWFLSTLYEPMLYGIRFPEEAFYPFSPVVQMIDHYEYICMKFVEGRWVYQGLGDGWGYLALYAGVGVALMGAALLMYRRRNLECAGDFIAVKPLAPIFSVVFTLCAGCMFALFAEAFNGSYVVFLIVGMIVGYFAGQMLLQRKVKVFNAKAFGKLGLLALAMLLSLGVTAMDPLGIVTWQPEKAEVEKVELYQGARIYEYSVDYIALQEEEDIEAFLEAHRMILELRSDRGRTISLRYTLTNGRQVQRTYQVPWESAAYEKVMSLYAKPEHVLNYTDWDTYTASVTNIRIGGIGVEPRLGRDQLVLLLEAIASDIRGNRLRPADYNFDDDFVCNIEILQGDNVQYLTISDSATDTLQWLKKYTPNWDFWEYSYTAIK